MILIYTKIKWYYSRPGFPSRVTIKCTDDEKFDITSILCDPSSEPEIYLDNLRTELVAILENHYTNPGPEFEYNPIIDFNCDIDPEGEKCKALALLDDSKIKLKSQETKEDNNCGFRLEE